MTLREACIELRSQLKRTYNDDIGSNPVFGDCYELIMEALETDKTEENIKIATDALEKIHAIKLPEDYWTEELEEVWWIVDATLNEIEEEDSSAYLNAAKRLGW